MNVFCLPEIGQFVTDLPKEIDEIRINLHKMMRMVRHDFFFRMTPDVISFSYRTFLEFHQVISFRYLNNSEGNL